MNKRILALTVVAVAALIIFATGSKDADVEPQADVQTASEPADLSSAKVDYSETDPEVEAAMIKTLKEAAAEEAEAAAEPTAEEKKAYLEAYGWMVGQQAGFEMGFSDEEVESIMAGLRRSASGEPAPEDMKDIFVDMQSYLAGKEMAYRVKMEAKMQEEAKSNIAAGEAYLAEVAQNADVKKTESGLYYTITEAGSDTKPSDSAMVLVHYTGKLINGDVFDSSVERGEPVEFPITGVIPGFSEGLKLLGEGGKATLYIPADLGYGNMAAGPIPAGSTLVFEVELIKVTEPAADDAAEE